MFFRRCLSSVSVWKTVREALSHDVSILPSEQVKTKGWIKSIRRQKGIAFMHINDGSSPVDLQIVAYGDALRDCCDVTYGSSVEVTGNISKSTHPSQPLELHMSAIRLIGSCDNEDYPFKTRTKPSTDFLRQFPHLRPRTKEFSSLLRIRNTATMAVHDFFQNKGFIQIHTPIITSSDCEGAGDLFHVLPSSELDSREPGFESAFFRTPAYLTVSGQLHAEAAACGMSRVYTFGPTFRAEKSHTRKHLSEFYMLEAETVLREEERGLDELMELAEQLCKHVFLSLVSNSGEDLALFHSEESVKTSFKSCLEEPYNRITYLEAVELLEKKDVSPRPKEGEDLSTQNEDFLVEYFGSQPLFVTDYPVSLKPFYAKENESKDGMVQALDLLMPGVGEVVGGTVRENDYARLKTKLCRFTMTEKYQWYLDLRRYGSVPHGGFGLGFDRLLQVALGVKNIRDVVPFPRYLGSCQM